MELLERVLDDAACIDIEVASIPEMGGLLETLQARAIPWLASFHDFGKLPDTAVLEDAARRAREAGANAFKAAATLHSPADMTRLADFQLADHGLPVATMGMGPLAPVSRLLCAQCGSVLNYGYLGETPTAPGQWDAGFLKQAIARLSHFSIRS
jgi:3-dehydroquinate dehydratase-1